MTSTTRTCTTTGLRLVPTPVSLVHRVSPEEFGPLNPRLRDEGAARTAWNRWDTPGGSTIYASESGLAAFLEVLPYVSPGVTGASTAGPLSVPLGDLFDDASADDQQVPLREAVIREMPGSTLVNAVTAGWRLHRRHYQLRLPPHRWMVDVGHSDSIAALNESYRGGVTTDAPLTISDLTSEDRLLTTDIARWIRSTYLDDGSLALGIRYVSKYGSNLTSYAIWLRGRDDDTSAVEAVEEQCQPIDEDHPDLLRAARMHQLRVW